MSQARGQPSDTDATLISGDSLIGDVAGIGRLGPGKHFGRYIVLRRIGAGERGIAWAAYDPELDRRVVIKLLRPRLVEPFVREAQAAVALAHPNLVPLHRVENLHGIVFAVMDHIVGATSLREWIDEGPHAWPDVHARLRKAGAALAAGHRAGLVHANFRPANVLLDARGEPKLSDLGLVERGDPRERAPQRLAATKRSDDSSTSADSLASVLTPADQKRGPWAYVAPELWAGGLADARADQFAYCVSVYEALYGERPFDGRSIQAVLLSIKEGRVRPPAPGVRVPRWLREIIVRGLAHDPKRRWPSMDELLDALARGRGDRGRRVAASVAAGVALLAGSAASLRAPASEPPVVVDCTEHQAELAFASAWSPERRAALEQRIHAVGRLWDDPLSVSLLGRIDAWADDWQAEWIDACAATRVRAEQSEATLERRLACLDRQRRRVDHFTEALLDAQPSAVARALDSFESLDRLDACRSNPAPLPEDPSAREQVEAVTAELDRVRALLLAGRHDDARERLLEPLPATDWAPLASERAMLEHRAAPTVTPEAIESLARALAEALAAGDQPLAAEIALELAELSAPDQLAWFELATALAERGDQPELLAEIWLARARRTADPRTVRDHALPLLLDLCDEDSPSLAEADHLLAWAAFIQRDHEAADAALERARERWRRIGGDGHPSSLALLGSQGHFALARGDFRLAERRFGEQVARLELAFDGSDSLLVEPLIALSTAQIRQGEHMLARASLRRAVEIVEPREHPHAVEALAAIALFEADRGQLDAARTHAAQALERADVPACDRAAALRARARVERRSGELEAAAADLHLALRDARSGCRVRPLRPPSALEVDLLIDLHRVELERGDLVSADELLTTAEDRILADTPSPWHLVQLALLRVELCRRHECSAPDYDVAALARREFEQLQYPDPALSAAFHRLLPEQDDDQP